MLLYKYDQFVEIKSITSSDETVVEVSETDGGWTLNPLKQGRVTITAEDTDGDKLTAECVIDGRVTKLGWESDLISSVPEAEDYSGEVVEIGEESKNVASYIIDTEHEYFDIVKMKATVTEPGVYRFSMAMDKYANTSAYSRTTRIAGFGVRDMIGGGMMGDAYQLSTWEIYNIKTPGVYEFASVVAKRGVDRESGVWATFEEYAYPLGFKNPQLGADGIVSGRVEGFYNPEDKTDDVVTNGSNVSIDVSVEQGDHVVGAAVTVTASSAGTLVENEVASATLSSNVADVSFDKTALQKMLSSIENAGIDAVFNVNVAEGSRAKVIHLTLNVMNSEVLPESTSSENGAVTVTVPFEGMEEGDTVEVYYLKDGKMISVDAIYDLGTKTVTFTTNHFSDYQISKVSEGKSGTIGHNITWTFVDGVLTISGLGEMAAIPTEWNELEIKKVVVDEGITSIRDFAFSEKLSLTEVTLPSTLKSIGYQAFYSTGLKEIVIPNSVTFIDYNAFANCQSLKKAIISDNVENLGMDIFNSCIALAEVKLPANATRIGVNTFYGCTALTKLTLPDKLKEIAQGAFTGSGLSYAVIPDSVTTMGQRCLGYGMDGTANTSFRICGDNEVAETYATGNGLRYGHVEEAVSGKKATCTETGLADGIKCSVCETVLVEQEVIEAKGHTEVIDNAVAATCTSDGKTEGKHCSVCETVLVKQEVVKAMGHTDVVDKAVKATCTADGKTEGKHCSVCKAVLVKQEVVKAAGHKWDAGVVTQKPTATVEGEKTYTCTVCDTTKKEAIPATGVCDRGETCALHKFTDTDTTWAHDGIEFAVNNGLMNGTGNGTTFDPAGTMTRAMLVTVLYRNEGSPKAGDHQFTDLTQDWYEDAVAWAAENGIVNGTGAPGIFNPDGAVTREQIATIMYRYAEYKGVDVSELGDLVGFPDAAKVSSWADKATKWAVGAGLITGKGTADGTILAPTDSADRASVATILMRFIQNVIEK